ncbi:MAG TPA: DNA-binding protein [Deltaproteobacteria bacterium]|nr:DNA-binding protein [Deltaproteobacteria bacterium]HPR56049.1 DNA-binding protein [Deltaproteobacteria bacterium]HXK47845.1 DNA-binding protein [Deltaproteobacteria bacterium]
MKKITMFLAVVTLFSLVFSTGTFAQRGMMWKGGGGWGPGTPYARMYNPQTLETMSGEVVSIDKITPEKGMSYGVHVILKTIEGMISVHLGPAWYIENQDVKIVAKDTIEVKGSRITFEGKPALIAMEVKNGEDVLTLRDANGFPVWSGWRRR